MKVKTIKVGVKSADELLEDAGDYMKRVARGETPPARKGVYFENVTAMRKALTEKRLEILKTIRHEKPASVYALAKLLDRSVKSVVTDLHYLEAVGLVDLKKKGEGRERTEPTVDYDNIRLEIAV